MTSREEIREHLERLDRGIERQLAPILDHPEFLRLRRAWEGVRYLARTLPVGEMLKLRVLDITRDEIRSDLDEARTTDGRRSVLDRQFHDLVFGSFGGEPFGMVVVDGVVDGSDARLLDDLDRVGRESHAVFVVAGEKAARSDGRDHLQITPADVRSPFSLAFTEASRAGTAWHRCGWFSDLEHRSGSVDGGGLASLLSAEIVARTAKWVAIMGRAREREGVERELNEWLSRYMADGEPTAERPLTGAKVTVEYDLDHERDLKFRLRLKSAWSLTPLPDGLEIVGRIVR